MGNNFIYGASVYFPSVYGEIKFEWEEIEIVKKHKDEIEISHPYFISSNVSTRYFGDSLFEKELQISNNLTCYYAKEKEKVLEWLKNKRSGLIQSYEFDFKRLQKSKIEEVNRWDVNL